MTTYAEIKKDFLFKNNPSKPKSFNRWAKIFLSPTTDEIHITGWQNNPILKIFPNDTMQFLFNAPNNTESRLIDKLTGRWTSFRASASIKTTREYIVANERFPYKHGMIVSLENALPLQNIPLDAIPLDRKILKHITTQLDDLDDIIWPIIRMRGLVPGKHRRPHLSAVLTTAHAWVCGNRDPDIINAMVFHILEANFVFRHLTEFHYSHFQVNLKLIKSETRKPLYKLFTDEKGT